MAQTSQPLPVVEQDPGDPEFFDNPYRFYDDIRRQGDFVFWKDYDLPMATTHAAVSQIMKHPDMGRAVPEGLQTPVPTHLQAFAAVEAHSLLELEPPAHSRIRRVTMSAFTSPRIALIAPVISQLADRLIDVFPEGPFDLIDAYAKPLAAQSIAAFLGVDLTHARRLQDWSNQMVAMYQARRDRQIEGEANAAAASMAAFMKAELDERRNDDRQDFLAQLVATSDEGGLSEAEALSTAILLMNAGHEATAHSLGNAVSILAGFEGRAEAIAPDAIAGTVEECLRFRPPLHMFTRYVYADTEVEDLKFEKDSQIGCLLGSACRDDAVWPDGNLFDPFRLRRPHLAFGHGIHSCVGAALARLELQIALPVLFARCPDLRVTSPPKVADSYHFHGFEALEVAVR